MVDLEKGEWEIPPRGYYLTNVRQKTIWRDEKTGATLALVRFPEGVADKIHSHPDANQIVIGLSGEIEMPDGKRVKINPTLSYHWTKGEKHGATKVTKESLMLFFWDGSPKPQIEK